MKGLKLAWSLIRVPKLFASLLLLPLLFSFILVIIQLIISSMFLQVINRDSKQMESYYQEFEQENVARQIIFGQGKPLAKIKVCRWIAGDAIGGEVPPSDACEPDRLDVALLVDDPATFDATSYEETFNGNTTRLHLCKNCHPDIVIDLKSEGIHSEIKSLWGLGVMGLAFASPEVREHHLNAFRDAEKIKSLLGKRYFQPVGFRNPIRLDGLESVVALILNIAGLIVISLWLALKAHRKVLDYFARNGALLPMVAATGKNTFYSALWIITLMRVGFFLLASLPITCITFSETLREEHLHMFFGDDPSGFVLWAAAIVSSLSLATLIASIADLQHRRSILTIMYRYLPILLCFLGALLWSASFIADGAIASFIRNLTTALPVVGVAPILVAPIFRPQFTFLVVHILLTVGLFTIALKYNSRWFAAHLEEL